ncbi:MAG: antibiotic biosynthesis monooxygenase, partial [Chryseolinea sp.]
MIVSIVNVYVKQEFVEDFKRITQDNHTNSIQEPGNFRFDVLQDEKDPTHFILYEAFESQADIEFHRETAHYFRWR